MDNNTRRPSLRNPCLYPAASPSPTALEHRLKFLYLPILRNPSPVLRNLVDQSAPLTHGGTVTMTARGPAILNHSAASFGMRALPIASSPLPFTLFARVIRTNASEAGIFQQYTGADAGRLQLFIGGTNHVRYSHPGDVISNFTTTLGVEVSIAIVENCSGPIRMYINGVLDKFTGTSLGYASDTNATLEATRDLLLLALAIWVGKALSPFEVSTLHNDRMFLSVLSARQPGSFPSVPPPSTTQRHASVHAMPNRPYWRRWWFRRTNP